MLRSEPCRFHLRYHECCCRGPYRKEEASSWTCTVDICDDVPPVVVLGEQTVVPVSGIGAALYDGTLLDCDLGLGLGQAAFLARTIYL